VLCEVVVGASCAPPVWVLDGVLVVWVGVVGAPVLVPMAGALVV
jgi:hypothetical protein